MIKTPATFPAILLFTLFAIPVYAQNLLDKKISVDVSNERLADVLKQISNKGNFYFSYNSSIIRRDSLVTLSAINKPIRQVLDQLCGNRYSWELNNNYIILRKALPAPAVITSQTPSAEKIYTVTGYVLNSETGEKVSNVSIYEKQHFASTLSDEKGFFTIKLKSRYNTTSLTISREFFEDTTIVIQPRYNQQLTIAMTPVAPSDPMVTISPVENELPDTIVIKLPADTLAIPALARREVNQVEKNHWAKFLLSAKQNVQSLNLKKFFADRSFQASLTPGLGSHGKLSAQVVNSFSVNVLGGYTAGVNGVELGGLFNINKKDVKYVQAAGLLNVTGGSVTGVQLAGLHNNVMENVTGVQASNISNFVRGNVKGVQLCSIHNHVSGSLTGIQASSFSNYVNGKVTGMQISGFHNHASDSVTGIQAAAITNFVRKNVRGMQIAAIGNVALHEVRGLQAAHFFNYAGKLRGMQIGLVNIADSSDGYSIGLVNIVFKGYHKLAISTNEVLDVNAAFKTGNSKLYSILLTGYRKRKNDSTKIFSFGYGLGHEFALGKKFTINPEFTTQYLYLGSWKYSNMMGKAHLQFNVKLGKYISLFAGPSFTVYYMEQKEGMSNYNFNLPSKSYHTFDLWDTHVKGWMGWNAGISIF
jgi:hypothetical protein